MSLAKLSRLIGLFTTLVLLFTGYCVYDLRNSVIEQHAIDAERTALQTLAKEAQDTSWNLTVAVRNYSVTGESRYVDEYNRLLAVREGKVTRPKHNFVAPNEAVPYVDLLRRNKATEAEIALIMEVLKRSQTLGKLEDEAFAKAKAGNLKEARDIVYGEQYIAQRREVGKPLDDFDDMLVKRLSAEAKDAAAAVTRNITMVCIFIALNVLLALNLSAFTEVRILRRLAACSDYAQNLAEGNYDVKLTKKYPDELGTMVDTLNHMVESLQARISEANEAMEHAKERRSEAEVAMKEAEAAKAQAERAKRDGMLQAANDLTSVVEAVGDVSRALSDGIARSDKGAKDQAHLALETAGSMDEMKEAVNAVARSASDASTASADVRSKAQEGVEQVAQVTESMAHLSAASAQISKDMEELGKQANGIGAILSVISDIADQTNLLALNAAIEAARAGEAGRGFAVVADEVRKLAEKTMSATQEVNQAISSIQNSVRTNIASVNGTGEMAQHVTEIVQRSGAVLDEILHLAEVSADQVRSIATASEEQSASGEHISQSVDTISDIAKQVAETMQDADNAVKELLQQSDRLSNLIEEMKRG